MGNKGMMKYATYRKLALVLDSPHLGISFPPIIPNDSNSVLLSSDPCHVTEVIIENDGGRDLDSVFYHQLYP